MIPGQTPRTGSGGAAVILVSGFFPLAISSCTSDRATRVRLQTMDVRHKDADKSVVAVPDFLSGLSVLPVTKLMHVHQSRTPARNRPDGSHHRKSGVATSATPPSQ